LDITRLIGLSTALMLFMFDSNNTSEEHRYIFCWCYLDSIGICECEILSRHIGYHSSSWVAVTTESTIPNITLYSYRVTSYKDIVAINIHEASGHCHQYILGSRLQKFVFGIKAEELSLDGDHFSSKHVSEVKVIRPASFYSEDSSSIRFIDAKSPNDQARCRHVNKNVSKTGTVFNMRMWRSPIVSCLFFESALSSKGIHTSCTCISGRVPGPGMNAILPMKTSDVIILWWKHWISRGCPSVCVFKTLKGSESVTCLITDQSRALNIKRIHISTCSRCSSIARISRFKDGFYTMFWLFGWYFFFIKYSTFKSFQFFFRFLFRFFTLYSFQWYI